MFLDIRIVPKKEDTYFILLISAENDNNFQHVFALDRVLIQIKLLDNNGGVSSGQINQAGWQYGTFMLPKCTAGQQKMLHKQNLTNVMIL